ncbi:hypothetical protein I6N98_15890 [Spongiibacter nanhainus]|uniref:Uncharacterized protein n=1 Tax=Spongiibacter nanhainus TaxID=2794344 RepID=A0A7T4QZZ6_9GAMM|nr:hypothetical protein [Spongiibacter nanhainus]QQD17802.1 hypothetical protein I6N98_15890 [Spongiibacter nanhainus]
MADLTEYLGRDWRVSFTEKCAENNHVGEVERLCEILAHRIEEEEITKPTKEILLRTLIFLRENPSIARKAMLKTQPQGRPVNPETKWKRFEYACHVAELKLAGKPLYENRESKGAFVLAAEKIFGNGPSDKQIRLMRQSWEEFKSTDANQGLAALDWLDEE